MFDSFKRALDWWLNGLVDAVQQVAARLSGRKRLRVVPSGQGYAIERPDKKGRTEMRLVQAADGSTLEPAAARRVISGQPVDMVLPAETALIRHLDPLPPESAQYLDGIVRHQVERLTPWLASDVLYGSRAEPVGPGDPRLAVTVAATARSMHAGMIAALRRAGVKDLRLLNEDPSLPAPIPIAVDSGAGEATRRTRARRVVGFSLVLAGLAAAGLCAFFYLDLNEVQSETAAVDEALEARRAVLLAAARKQDPVEQQEIAAMITRKREAPIAVLALDSLSTALPDDTFISEMRLGEGKVRLIGTSKSVAGLVPLVEGTTTFSEAGFFAPTTRLAEGRGDRFHIDAKWLPPGAPQ